MKPKIGKGRGCYDRKKQQEVKEHRVEGNRRGAMILELGTREEGRGGGGAHGRTHLQE